MSKSNTSCYVWLLASQEKHRTFSWEGKAVLATNFEKTRGKGEWKCNFNSRIIHFNFLSMKGAITSEKKIWKNVLKPVIAFLAKISIQFNFLFIKTLISLGDDHPNYFWPVTTVSNMLTGFMLAFHEWPWLFSTLSVFFHIYLCYSVPCFPSSLSYL